MIFESCSQKSLLQQHFLGDVEHNAIDQLAFFVQAGFAFGQDDETVRFLDGPEQTGALVLRRRDQVITIFIFRQRRAVEQAARVLLLRGNRQFGSHVWTFEVRISLHLAQCGALFQYYNI